VQNTEDFKFKIPNVKAKMPKTKEGINPFLILGTLVHFRSF
jgi:hypothetical protein